MVRRSKQVLVPVDRHLATCISVRREVCGLSASNLDRRARLKPGSVARLERGELRLKPVQLLALADALGLDVDTFFDDAPMIERSDDFASRHVPAAEAEELVRAYIAITSATARSEFAALVRAVADSEVLWRDIGNRGEKVAS